MLTIGNKFSYESKIEQLPENDYDAALGLLNEIVEKINELFDAQLEYFINGIEKFKAEEAKGDRTKVSLPQSVLEKDRTALESGKECFLDWQKRYAKYIVGLPKFVSFMKEFQANENDVKENGRSDASDNFDRKLKEEIANALKVYWGFNQQTEEFCTYFEPMAKVYTEHSDIVECRLDRKPLNPETYTQEIATSIGVQEAFQTLFEIQGLLGSMIDVTSKAWRWLKSDKTLMHLQLGGSNNFKH